MKLNRRQLIGSVAFAAGAGAPLRGADSDVTLNALRIVSTLSGVPFGDDQLRIVQPVIEQRRPQLRRLRAYELDDAVAPTHGILEW